MRREIIINWYIERAKVSQRSSTARKSCSTSTDKLASNFRDDSLSCRSFLSGREATWFHDSRSLDSFEQLTTIRIRQKRARERKRKREKSNRRRKDAVSLQQAKYPREHKEQQISRGPPRGEGCVPRFLLVSSRVPFLPSLLHPPPSSSFRARTQY